MRRTGTGPADLAGMLCQVKCERIRLEQPVTPMKRYKPEQIVTLLRQIQAGIFNGELAPQARKEAEIAPNSVWESISARIAPIPAGRRVVKHSEHDMDGSQRRPN